MVFPNPLSPFRTPHNARRGFVPLVINFFSTLLLPWARPLVTFRKKRRERLASWLGHKSLRTREPRSGHPRRPVPRQNHSLRGQGLKRRSSH